MAIKIGLYQLRAKAALLPLAVLPKIAYLTLPVSVHPMLILLLGEALLDVAVALTSSKICASIIY
ncbi:TPA: DUF4400 domain-containing protein [Yersinia enterocolitica]|nr:DUF4400 domain-containing protein [Yersinia enterocolitica]HDY4931730.1 DUF4400 domain-containing protein [Yersinia enterocolitica]HEC1635248.1 DUF4400 domain-containing protein [Yersinia enterocolitica]HED0389660.1 DUF4400 domain-containing protein [Yersinia enterocolitica]